jgi:acyl-CoA synthetase (NDP forming)
MISPVSELKTIINQIDNKANRTGIPFAVKWAKGNQSGSSI